MTPAAPDAVAAVEQLLRQRIGLEPASLGRDRIAQAVAVRLASLGRDAADYLHLLSENEEELRALVEEVVVPETWFFRDLKAFRCLCRQAREPRPPSQRFRVLSVPCSTGEEPYSIVLSLLGAGLGADDFEVVAADLSPAALATAAAGRYAELAFREREAEFLALRDRFCRRDGERYVLDEAVRGAVRFLRANLAAPQFLAAEPPFHAIFCRNLFIYLDEPARRTALAHLRRLLLPNGALYFSAVEAGALSDPRFRKLGKDYPFVFTPVRSGEVPTATAVPPPAPPPSKPRAPKARSATRPVRHHTAASAARPRAQTADAGSTVDALTKARQAADAGRLEEAASLCTALADRGAPRADVLYLLGVVRQAQGDFAEAERCFQRVLYLDPRHHEALVHMALLARRRGDERLAENFRRRADNV
jgi:chemotaxis protein methyltransferase WspC